MNTRTITPKSVDYAIRKLDTFVLLNRDNEEEDEKLEALNRFCEALGFDEDCINALYWYCDHKFGPASSHTFVGALIGLAIAEHACENDN